MNYLGDKKLIISFIPLIFSTIFLLLGTYAWFTYFSDVDSTMTGHVIGWNIDFDGETKIEDEFDIVINQVYPGMKEYLSELTIKNSGEATAIIESHIKKIRIFDEELKVGDIKDDKVLTSEDLQNYLTSNYPFIFNVSVDKSMIASGESSKFSFTLNWDYETYVTPKNYIENIEYFIKNNDHYEKVIINQENFDENKSNLFILNDEEDTLWGEKAYRFINENDGIPCIELSIEINASQFLDEDN